MNNRDIENELDLDDELQEQFGDEFSSSVLRQMKNKQKKNNNKQLKFHKDGYFDKNRK
jgi:hypothetical protein